MNGTWCRPVRERARLRRCWASIARTRSAWPPQPLRSLATLSAMRAMAKSNSNCKPSRTTRLRITVADKGPGIANLQEVLDGLYKSDTGLGMGIVGTRRLMDSFAIETGATGTQVVMGKALPPHTAVLTASGFKKLVDELDRREPQNPFEEIERQNRELLKTLADLRARQDELALLNRELEDTNRGVVALYAELDERADYLRRASELKTNFLSNMSHEFRTPLNSIISLTRILQEKTDGDLSPEQEKQVRFIQRSAQELYELVNDLLDLAKVEAGKVTVKAEGVS